MTAEDKAKNAGKVALVLEGGSFRGQFTAGVLDVLMEAGVEIPGRAFRLDRRWESAPRSERGFRDELSASHSFGNCIPFRTRIPGCTFRLSCHWESISHSTARFRVAVSA